MVKEGPPSDLLLTSLYNPPLLRLYFQVNKDVWAFLHYVEDIYLVVLFVSPQILNPDPMNLPLLLLFKKNMNAPRPSEHPPVRGKKCQNVCSIYLTSPTFTILLVCVFSSFSFWTSSSLDVPAGVTQEKVHTRFFIHLPSAVRALIFLARRIQPFLSLVDREVDFCVLAV